jgi:hypothetical protein
MCIRLVSGEALTECHLDGKPYRTGAVVDGKRCGADGYWYPE